MRQYGNRGNENTYGNDSSNQSKTRTITLYVDGNCLPGVRRPGVVFTPASFAFLSRFIPTRFGVHFGAHQPENEAQDISHYRHHRDPGFSDPFVLCMSLLPHPPSLPDILGILPESGAECGTGGIQA